MYFLCVWYSLLSTLSVVTDLHFKEKSSKYSFVNTLDTPYRCYFIEYNWEGISTSGNMKKTAKSYLQMLDNAGMVRERPIIIGAYRLLIIHQPADELDKYHTLVWST